MIRFVRPCPRAFRPCAGHFVDQRRTSLRPRPGRRPRKGLPLWIVLTERRFLTILKERKLSPSKRFGGYPVLPHGQGRAVEGTGHEEKVCGIFCRPKRKKLTGRTMTKGVTTVRAAQRTSALCLIPEVPWACSDGRRNWEGKYKRELRPQGSAAPNFGPLR